MTQKSDLDLENLDNHHDHQCVKQNYTVHESTWREIVSSQADDLICYFLDIKNLDDHQNHQRVKQKFPVQESTWREIVEEKTLLAAVVMFI